MKTNMGAFDGWFRTLLFLLSICYAILAPSLFAYLLIVPGAILFGSAVLTWCPIYEILGVDTHR